MEGDLLRVQGIPVRVGGAEKLIGGLSGVGGQSGPVVQPQEQPGGSEQDGQGQKQSSFTGKVAGGGIG